MELSDNSLQIDREIKKGQRFFREGNFIQAEKWLDGLISEQAIAKNFMSPVQELRIRVLLGWIYIELEELDMAKEQFQIVLNHKISYQRHLVLWGMAVSCGQDIHETDRYLTASLEYSPRCFSKYHLEKYGAIYSQRGEYYLHRALNVIENVGKVEYLLSVARDMYERYEEITGEKIDLSSRLSKEEPIRRIASFILNPSESLVFLLGKTNIYFFHRKTDNICF